MAKVTTKIWEDAGTTWSVIDKNGDGIINGGLFRKDKIQKDDLDAKTEPTKYKLKDPVLLNELGLSAKGYTSLKGIAVADLQKYFDALTVKDDDPDDVSLAQRVADIKVLPPFGTKATIESLDIEGWIDPSKGANKYYRGDSINLSLKLKEAKPEDEIFVTIQFKDKNMVQNQSIGKGNGPFALSLPAPGAWAGGQGLTGDQTGPITVILVEKKPDDTFQPLGKQGTVAITDKQVKIRPVAVAAPKKSGGSKAKPATGAKPAATATPATGGGLNE